MMNKIELAISVKNPGYFLFFIYNVRLAEKTTIINKDIKLRYITKEEHNVLNFVGGPPVEGKNAPFVIKIKMPASWKSKNAIDMLVKDGKLTKTMEALMGGLEIVLDDEINMPRKIGNRSDFPRLQGGVYFGNGFTATIRKPSWFAVLSEKKSMGKIKNIGRFKTRIRTLMGSIKQEYIANALRRYYKSKTEGIEDKIVDLTIALESLTNSDNAFGSISYKTPLRTVFLLHKPNYAKKNQYIDFKFLRRIYSQRSKIVHGGKRTLAKLERDYGRDYQERFTALVRSAISTAIELNEKNLDEYVDKKLIMRGSR